MDNEFGATALHCGQRLPRYVFAASDSILHRSHAPAMDRGLRADDATERDRALHAFADTVRASDSIIGRWIVERIVIAPRPEANTTTKLDQVISESV